MIYILVLFLCAEALGASVRVNINGVEKMYYDIDEAEQLFEQFIVDFDKSYATEEVKLMRFNIFKKNLQEINDLNARHQTIYGITLFSDLTSEEFFPRGVGLLPEEMAMPCQTYQSIGLSSAQVAGSFDWRDRNIVTPVKNQGDCGSCWAHSIIGCLESQVAMRQGQILDLSEQQLVDCEPHNNCVQGGFASNGGIYLENYGAMLESEYPYVAHKEGFCQYNPNQAVVKPTQCTDFTGSSEQELMSLLAQYGPISVAVDGEALKHHYGSGIIEDCTSYNCTHAVLLVGYNTNTPQPYWILKNSWSTNWGEQGFFRIPLGSTACMITKCPMVGLQI